ncbi:phage head-tail adapter protein [Escherichia coli]|nr:phage head-tail adapter protein [Escherichia coli]EHR9096952.1 phage head-tail adapter protein [Escherichia coli]EIM2919087.1 phage head-tail adapter protein [Escherichia coli]EIM2935049.1 phage head-tail adapter protein [Escherichia coli]EIM2959660.1 phage head-tail adapter protein [Escherichia coli]
MSVLHNAAGPLAGMSREQLKSALSAAQQAYTELMTGRRGVSFSYSQGDGPRSVTYTAVSSSELLAFIQLLQRALGIRSRHAIRFRY